MSALLFPRAAFGFLTSVATSLFCSRGSTSLLGPTKSSSSGSSGNYHADLERRINSKEANKFGSFPWEKSSECQLVKAEEEPLSDEKDLQILGQTILKKDIQVIKDGKEVSLGSDKPGKFKQFDIVDDYSDHHFVNGTGNGSMLSQVRSQLPFLFFNQLPICYQYSLWFHSSQVKRAWLKKVQQEWCLLEKDLPGWSSF